MLTVVIPVGPYHEAIAERAVASCLCQTLRVSVVVVYDREGRGSGWARNRGLEQVQTPFVTFLDADDEIAPTFAEACLRSYDGKRYIFTDWFADKAVQAPDCPWRGDGTSHIVTTLLPTAWVRFVGGFDEVLHGCEDTAFYWKLTRAGLCGKRLPEALFTYHDAGQRSKAWQKDPDYMATMERVIAAYGDQPMACCNDSVTRDEFPPGEAQAGDVLASILQAGPRQFIGRVTGRLYRRRGNAHQLYVNPADIDAAPQLFSRVIDMPKPPTEDDFRQFANTVMQELTRNVKPAPEPAPAVYGVPGTVQPNVGQVIRLYQNTQQ